MCDPCKAGRHQDCILGDCECSERNEQEALEQRLRAIRSSDERLANSVYTTLLYGGSDVARMLTDGAGRDSVRLFVQQIIGTIKTMNC